MAKKNAKNTERRAMVEQMRAEQARKERMRSLAILGTCIVIVVGLLGVAVFKYVDDKREQDRLDNLQLDKIGARAATAGCDAVTSEEPKGAEKSGADGSHVATGTKIDYKTSPPAFGQHWPNFLTSVEYRSFYTPEDRPEVERLVHGLEHGHTLIWYDDTIKAGSKEYQDLEAIANKYDGTTTYVNIVPWTAADGAPFKDGKHVVLTHWSESDGDQNGRWQYCAKPSGEVINDFVKKYPDSDAPEGGAQ